MREKINRVSHKNALPDLAVGPYVLNTQTPLRSTVNFILPG